MQRKNRLFTFKLTDHKEYFPFIALSIVFVVGVLIGNLLVGRNEYAVKIAFERLSDDVCFGAGASILSQIFTCCLSLLPYFLMSFVMGTSVVGVAVVPFVLLCFGFEYGCISGYLYSNFNLEGVIYTALLMLPSTVIALLGMLKLSKESVLFSLCLANSCIKQSKPVNLYNEFKKYCVSGSLTFVFAICSVFYDVVMSRLFFDYFNFTL